MRIGLIAMADLFDVQITIQTPFPRTPLFERLKREGRLLHDQKWGRCALFDVNYLPSGIAVEQLQEGFRNLGVDLYSSEWTRARRERFNRSLRARRNRQGSMAS